VVTKTITTASIVKENRTNHEQQSSHLDLHQEAASQPALDPDQSAMMHLLVDAS